MQDNYYLKEGYKSQEHNYTLSQKDSDLYWTKERIILSYYAKYDLYKLAAEIIRKHKIKSVIDVGCGVATKLMKLIYPFCKDITGVDQKEAIEYCKRTHDAGNFIIDNLENPSTCPGTFDLIICCDVIEHLLNPDKLLEYVKRLTNESSFILLSTPERDIIRGRDCMGSTKLEHVREWNREEFAAYLRNRGLKILEHRLFPANKFSFNRSVIFSTINTIKQAGTLKTNQLALCKWSD